MEFFTFLSYADPCYHHQGSCLLGFRFAGFLGVFQGPRWDEVAWAKSPGLPKARILS